MAKKYEAEEGNRLYPFLKKQKKNKNNIEQKMQLQTT